MGFYSIITDDTEHCLICGRPFPHKHHAMNAANKKKAEQYGLLVPLCERHHTGDEGVHRKQERMLAMKQLAQIKFEEKHSRELWLQEFGKSYL